MTLDEHLSKRVGMYAPQWDEVRSETRAAVRDWLVELAEVLSRPTIDERASRRDAERAQVLRWLADTNDVAGVG